MTENTTISGGEESSLLTSATEDEILVAQILLDLPNIIKPLESGPSFQWIRRKRRSRLNGARPSIQKTDVETEETQPQAKAAEEATAAATATSPVTPLAFPPSESDEKSKHASKRSSRKRSREEYSGMIEELTRRRDLLRGEIENVTSYYNKLIAYNSELKAMKQKVLNSCPKKEEPKLEISRERDLGLELTQDQPQPLVADRMAEKLQHPIGLVTAQFQSSYNGLGSSVNHVDPLGIPDLNISAEEAFEVDQSQPLDMSRDFTDRRARFAEARRRRKDIIKIKSMRSASCGIIKLPRTRLY